MPTIEARDERLIDEAFQELLESCNRICKNEQDWDFIRRAFFLAKEAHKGVRRRSGEPYITHPIAVAKIVVDEIGLGVKSVVASLLHDVVEDTAYSVEEIEEMFGAKIATMVDGLTKMAGVFNTDASESSEQAEYFRKVLLTLSDDVRVILIKIADRLHNMRTLGSMPVAKQIKITSETIYLFAPLAHRLGLYAIKTELEDLCLKYRFPDQYEEIGQKLSLAEEQRARFIEQFNAPIAQKLSEAGIDFTIEGRIKSVYSIWSKMQRKQIPFEEIYDLFAIRIVFKPRAELPEKSQCWYIFSLIADIYTPRPDRIRDWVSIPKANGYEALHGTVMGPEGTWVEVQIRSERMEDIAERGFAAHWKYKQADISDEGEFDKWLKKIREALSGPTESAVDFLDNFKMSLYAAEIVVFTPKGEARQMPRGASVLDFAYDIHTNVGNRAIGAKINHKIESIYTSIASGDQIEIITSETAHPKLEWLDHVATTKARQAIKNYLRRDKAAGIERGMEIFEAKMKEFGIQPSARVFRKLLPAYECSSKDEFYSNLAVEIISLDGVEKILRENAASKVLKYWTLQLINPLGIFGGGDSSKKKKEVVVTQSDLDAPRFEIAECCHPIPGDDVVGFKEPEGEKIVVHKTKCDVLTRLASQHGDCITSIKWSSHKAQSFLTVLSIRGIDRMGMLVELSQAITNELQINIRELQVQSHDGIFEGEISLYVRSADDLNALLRRIGAIKGVENVKRKI